MSRKLLAALLCLACVASAAFAGWPNDVDQNKLVVESCDDGLIEATSDGGFFVGYSKYVAEAGYRYFYLMRYDANGDAAWTEPKVVCDRKQKSMYAHNELLVDADDNAIFAISSCNDPEDEYSKLDIHVYKISPDGSDVWDPDGVIIRESALHDDVDIYGFVASDGNCIIGWNDQSDYAPYLTSLASDGSFVWEDDSETPAVNESYRRVVPDGSYAMHPRIVSGGNDGSFIVAYTPIYGRFPGMALQKYNAAGEAQWNEGDPVLPYTVDNYLMMGTVPTVTADEHGGAYIYFGEPWVDSRSHVTVQHVMMDGTCALGDNGVRPCADLAMQNGGAAGLVLPNGNFVIAFEQYPDNDHTGISAQCFNPEGNVLWGENGKTIMAIDDTDDGDISISLVDDAIIIEWTGKVSEPGSPGNTKGYLYACAVDFDGTPLWNTTDGTGIVTISGEYTEKSTQNYCQTSDKKHVVLFVEGPMTGTRHLYFQNVNPDGTIGDYAAKSVEIVAPADAAEVTTASVDVDVTATNCTIGTEEGNFSLNVTVTGPAEETNTFVSNTEDFTVDFTENGGYEIAIEVIAVNGEETAPIFPAASAKVNVTVNNPEFAQSVAITSPEEGATIEAEEGAETATVNVAVTVNRLVIGTEEGNNKLKLTVNGPETNTSAVLTSVDNIVASFTENGAHEIIVEVVDAAEASLDPVIADTVNVTVNGILAVADGAAQLPKTFAMNNAYPNPFNPSTTIALELPRTAQVSVIVFDMMGREVATLVNGNMTAGVHKLVWNANNVASGIYFVRMQSEGFEATQKIVRLK